MNGSTGSAPMALGCSRTSLRKAIGVGVKNTPERVVQSLWRSQSKGLRELQFWVYEEGEELELQARQHTSLSHPPSTSRWNRNKRD